MFGYGVGLSPRGHTMALPHGHTRFFKHKYMSQSLRERLVRRAADDEHDMKMTKLPNENPCRQAFGLHVAVFALVIE